MVLVEPERIERLRKQLDLTQSELAERAGVTQEFISRIEAADVNVTVPTLRKISEVLAEESEQLKDEIESGIEKHNRTVFSYECPRCGDTIESGDKSETEDLALAHRLNEHI